MRQQRGFAVNGLFKGILGAVAPGARERQLSAPLAADYKGVISVHRDHDVFIQGIEREKRLVLTFFRRKHSQQVVSLCAPLHYGKGPAGLETGAEGELECYYLWDFEAEKDNNFLALSPSQIVSMEPTDDVFHIQEFYSQSNPVGKPATEPDINE